MGDTTHDDDMMNGVDDKAFESNEEFLTADEEEINVDPNQEKVNEDNITDNEDEFIDAKADIEERRSFPKLEREPPVPVPEELASLPHISKYWAQRYRLFPSLMTESCWIMSPGTLSLQKKLLNIL